MRPNKAGIVTKFAKRKEYRKVLEKIIKTDKCPFCPDNFKYHKKPILKTYQGWLATTNSWPYKDSQYHFLFICKKHMTEFHQLTDKDFQAIKYLVNWVIIKYKVKGGGLNFRFGDQNFTGASVNHLHCHLIVPALKLNSKNAKTVYFPIG